MSSLQCTNIHFETTANNRIQYISDNTYAFVAGGSNVMVVNTSVVTYLSNITYNTVTFTSNVNFSGTINISQANVMNQVLLDGTTVTWNVAQGQVATLTLGGTGRTMAAPTNMKVGSMILHVYQDATGSRTITSWNSVFKWPAGVAPTITSAANAHDVFSFVCDGTYLYGTWVPDVK